MSSDYGGIPIVRLELQGMKATLLHAIGERQASFDADVRAAVEQACSPANIRAVIEHEVQRSLEAAIADEVRRFYQSGEGRQAVRDAIRKRLGREEGMQ